MNQNEKLAINQEDPWLDPYVGDVHQRYERFQRALNDIERVEGSLLDFAKGHYYYGINFDPERNGWYYREWAPNASQLFLTGDFNGWDRTSHQLEKNFRMIGRSFYLMIFIRIHLNTEAK
jgi:1,4-alpha-glucan branching enzyme